MFAVIETGGKQYRVEKGLKVKIEKLAHDGGKIVFDKVLLRGKGNEVEIGAPFIKGAHVEGKFLEEKRDRKKIVFRYHSKTRYRKKKGHRQTLTLVEIVKI